MRQVLCLWYSACPQTHSLPHSCPRGLIPQQTLGLPGFWILTRGNQRVTSRRSEGSRRERSGCFSPSSSSPALTWQSLFLLPVATVPGRQPLCYGSSSCYILVTLSCPWPWDLGAITVSHCSETSDILSLLLEWLTADTSKKSLIKLSSTKLSFDEVYCSLLGFCLI